MANNIVTLEITATTIQQGAFSQLSASVTGPIDLVINISGTIVIEAGAFQQVPNEIQINSATVNFVEVNGTPVVVTLGADAFANLPIQSLVLPAEITLQANALRSLQDLRVLDLSAVTTDMVTNSLNLTRTSSEPLVMSMPSSNQVSYEQGAIVIPPTAVNKTTTLVFNGSVAPANAFTLNPAVTAAIQVSINPNTDSTQLQENIVSIVQALTVTTGTGTLVPTTASYSEVQNVIQNPAQTVTITPGAYFVSVTQFSGDYFDNCVIAPKDANANKINQCAVIGLTADAIKNNVQTLRIPDVVTLTNAGVNTSYSVINLASRMTLANHNDTFYILDNYHDPSDADLDNIDVPLVAVFSRVNATATAFKPALVCNGIISNINGAITVSGSRGAGAANKHCRGHSATQSTAASDLHLIAITGSQILLFDAGASENAAHIASITFPTDTTFVVQFNPIQTTGCFEKYAPAVANASMVVDFTSVARASGAASNSFSAHVASLVANNNALTTLLAQIKAEQLPPITLANPFPTVVSISPELTALSKSDFHSVLSAWKILRTKHNTQYVVYLANISAYVTDVIQKTTAYPIVKAKFDAYTPQLNEAIQLVSAQLTDAGTANGPFYVAAVRPYFGTRFSIGMQAFNNCQLLDHVVNFNLLGNISKINDDTFNSCTVLKSPANIPINVSSIGLRAYQNCIAIPSIDIQDAFALRTIGESAFEGCMLMEGNLSFSSAIGYSDSVEVIGDKAFMGCVKLTDHLYFPPTLKSLGVSAFDGCIGLNGTIVFPRNTNFTVIPDRAFANCSEITGISTNTGNGSSLEYMGGVNGSGRIPNGLIIPVQVTRIGKEAFLNCSKFALALNLNTTPNPNPAAVTLILQLNIEQIGNAAFNGCAAFTSLVLPSRPSYTVVANDCFRGCTSVQALTIPSNVKLIQDGAFFGCNKIANVPKFDNITTIGNEAFCGCAGMIGPLVLGTNLNILGDRAFFDCKFLTSATFLGSPPPGLSASSLIFGLTAASPTTFHVNVFTENAWNEASIGLINAVFRASATNNTVSVVNMAFIEFNTYLPSPMSRDLTISNFKSFNVYANTGFAGANQKLTAPTDGFSWNDVYIPGTLKGTNLGNAQSNSNNLVATLQSQVASLITPKADAVQTRSVDLLFSANEALREFDGRNMAVATDTLGAPLTLEVLANAGAARATAGYGVFTVNTKDYLYYSAEDNQQSTLVKSTNNANVSFFVKAAESVTVDGFKTKYANKLISVGSDGEIFVSTILPIGYDVPTGVARSTILPKTSDINKMYTIFKSGDASVKDKLYFKAIIAPAGAYWISTLTGDLVGAELANAVIHVDQDGFIDVPVRQLKNNFKIISNLGTSNMNAGGGYWVAIASKPDANTNRTLMYSKNPTDSAVAAPGYYLILSAATAPPPDDKLNLRNTMILVLPNGGVSTGSFGALGSINALDQYASAVALQSIPLYNDNVAVSHFSHYMDSILPLNHNNYRDAMTDFDAKFDSFITQAADLNTQVTTTSMKNAISSIPTHGSEFVTSVVNLNTAVGAANGVINGANDEVSLYYNLVDDLKTAGNSLKTIQTNTMTSITAFQHKCTFNSSPTATVNDKDYITAQINTFVTALLLREQAQRINGSAFDSIIKSVKENVSFVVSPTNVSPAPQKLYAELSIQQQILFDFTASVISQWLLKGNSWTEFLNGNIVGPTALLTWATTNILARFNGSIPNQDDQTIYQQFLTNNVVPSLANVRTSVTAYEGASSNPDAHSAYQTAVLVKVNDVTANFTVDNQYNMNPPAVAMGNGKLGLNNNTTQIYISLNDSTAVTPVEFNRFADRIALSNGSIFIIKSVKTSTFCHTLDVTFVSGPTSLNNGEAITFYTYQAVSSYAFQQLNTMNSAVRAQYYQNYAGVSGIKAQIVSLKTSLLAKASVVSSKLSLMSVSVANLQQQINLVNDAENKLTAHLQSQSGNGITALDLAGAQMLSRELELFGFALTNQAAADAANAAIPSVATLPTYESSWFNQRVAAFWADSIKVDADLKPTVVNRTAAYTIANNTFKAARYARQSAAIDLYIATTPPSQTMTSLINTQFASEQARTMMQTMPAYITTNKEALALLISTKVATYVKARDDFIAGGDRATRLAEYKQMKTVEFTKTMNNENYAYGKAAYNRYLIVIDLAISTAFYALANGDQTNEFNTLMQQWYTASNRSAIFENIKPLLFDLVYTTNTTVYSPTVFPLKVGTENIAWFGAPIVMLADVKRDGFLYTIIKNSWQFVKDAYNSSAMGIPFSVYNVENLTVVSPPLDPVDLPTPPTLIAFSTGMANAINAENMAAGNNLAEARNVVSSVSSLEYSVVSIGYDSLAKAEATSLGLNVLGFTDVTNQASLNFQIENNADNINNALRYKFTLGGAWYHGYQQSSNLINAWLKLSPAQNAVVFYAGTGASIPSANLHPSSQTSLTTLCDDAAYVMIIEAIAGSTTKSVALYTYDVMGLNSGNLVAVGKLVPAAAAAPVSTLYSANGAFQKSLANANINLIGDLILPSSVKTIGINAFAKSSKIKSLSFGAGDAGSLSIGSNAFQECTELSALNLGSTVGSIGPSAFLKCSGANSLALPTSNLSVVNHWAFLGCSNLGKTGNLVLPATLQQINVQAFAGCPFLKCPQLNGGGSNYIPQTLQKLGVGAFLGCTSLTGALDFNNVNNAGAYVSSISFIGSAAFMGCTGLNGEVNLPINPNYTNVLPYVFSSADAPIYKISGDPMLFTPPAAPNAQMALTGAVNIANTKITSIETRAFHKCSALSGLTLSNLVTKVGVQSFLNCIGLSGVLNIPASVLNVHTEAFMGCSKLNGLNIVSATVSADDAGSGTSLGIRCFKNCSSLVGSNATSGLVIPNNVIKIEDNAFEGCASIEALTVGSGFTKAGSFGANLFSGCTKLARVVLAFSFLSRDVVGQSVIKNATGDTLNASFTGCTALGVVPGLATTGTVQIQSGATGWTAGRAAFFNQLTIVVNNKNITFYLKEFNKNISVVDPSKDAVQLEALPITDAQAVVYIKASDMRKVFQVSTDSYVTPGGDGATSDTGKLFFVRPDLFPQYLNVANALVVQGGIESYNSKPYEQLVKDDVMRYYATSLFNSADWVTLFSNDVEMMENMVASSGLMPIVPNGDTEAGKNRINEGVLNKIMSELNKIAYNRPAGPIVPGSTVNLVASRHPAASPTKWSALPDTITPENGNIGMKLFNLINRNDPGRITSMVLNGSTPSELPFLPGDQFVFVFTLNDNEVQLSAELQKVTVKQRTYMIRLALTNDFVAGSSSFADHTAALYSPSPVNLNVLPVSGAYTADHMYSNYDLYVATKPSLLNQTDVSVYSKITKNTYEPVPMPFSLLPFTGWYYNYQHSTQALKLDFTPPDNSDVNYSYSDMRYLSAYIYFPDAWSSQTALPNPTNFPQWAVTFKNTEGTITLYYKAEFLPKGGPTNVAVNFLGQPVAFDYTNTHVQLICPFDTMPDNLATLLAGKLADGITPGTANVIAGTNIYRQKYAGAGETVSGLRKPTSNTGPFTYPPIARGYQGIYMALSTDQAQDLTDIKNGYQLDSITLDINMTNNNGFVPSIIVKSVEVVAKKYEAYYLAPLDPN